MNFLRSQRSPLDPVKIWPAGKAKLAGYHGLDQVGSTSAAVSTLTLDRMLGHTVPLGLGFLGQGSWAGLDIVNQSLGGYAGLRENVIVSIPMTQPGTALANVAAGEFNSYFTTIGEKIRDLGFIRAIWRIGWEFNGDWYPWSARNVEGNYIGAFRQIVNTARAVPGTYFEFLWNPDKKAGRYALSTYADPTDCYPGDGYVDYIGVDAYNGWVNGSNAPTKNANGTGGSVAAGDFPYPIPTQAARWRNELLGEATGNQLNGTSKPFCLNWNAAFAAEHGKRIIIPEWGTGYDTARAGENCGDDGYYVEKMGRWIVDNNVYAHGYWDRLSPSHYNARLSYSSVDTGIPLDDKPASRASFITAFGA